MNALSKMLKGRSPLLLLGAALLLLLVAGPAFGSETGTGMEWEAPIQSFYRSITGPVAFAIAILGIVVCGAILIWGGEINEFVRRFVMVILVVSVIMFAGPLLRRMFAGGAALITPPVASAMVGERAVSP